MDKRQEVIEALKDKSDEEMEQEFSELIREEMTDKQFWSYVQSWKDGDALCSEMEDWDTETKKEEIINIKKNFLK